MSFAGSGGASPVRGFVESSIGLEAKLLQQDGSNNSTDDVSGDRGVALNIIILMGGLKIEKNSRYPRPLMNIVGRPIIFWLIDHLRVMPSDTIWIVVPRDLDNTFALTKQLHSEFSNFDIRIVHLLFDTVGPVESVFVALQAMEDSHMQRRTISLDCNTLYFSNVLDAFRKVKDGYGASFYFVQDEEGPATYSYISLNRRGLITDIREKVLISRLANTGAYGFPSARKMLDTCEHVLDGVNQDSPLGTLYLSTAIRTLISEGVDFMGVHVPSFACLASQQQLDEFLYHVKEGTAPLIAKRIRFCFDLDNTLVTLPKVPGDYTSVEPIPRNIELVRQLHAAGHHIIIQTSRGMRDHAGNLGQVMRDVGRSTFNSLHDFDIPYDELIFGKPEADVYVGHRAVNSLIDTIQEVGWFVDPAPIVEGLTGAVAPRDFNTVRPVSDTHVYKSGPREVMAGEVYWYRNIPQPLVDLFPELSRFEDYNNEEGDVVSLVMSRVQGITFSQLLTNSAVTKGRLQRLLDGLQRVHDCPPSPPAVHSPSSSPSSPSYSPLGSASVEVEAPGDGGSNGGGGGLDPGNMLPSTEEIASNYAPKIRDRFKKFHDLYMDFAEEVPDLERMHDVIVSFLEEYVSEERCIKAHYIHGDPVLSNCLLEPTGQVKYLDMRGGLGKRLTTQGDVLYDLSKVYQSLCGYDFLLLDQPIKDHEARMLDGLRQVFWESAVHYAGRRNSHDTRKKEGKSEDEYAAELQRDVKVLTASHFFGIVPLHEVRARQVQYLQFSRSILIDSGLL